MDEPERNQPPSLIPGGPRRPSSRVSRQNLLGVATRERVTALLRIHDFDEAQQALAQLTETDEALVRQIAREGAASGADPVLRYKAISALSGRPSVENLNLLVDLAQFGEDFYVRGHALLGLGHTQMIAHLPTVLAHLEADDQFERVTAFRAFEMITLRTSPAAVEAHAGALGGPKALELARKAIARLQSSREMRPNQRSQSERREKRPRPETRHEIDAKNGPGTSI